MIHQPFFMPSNDMPFDPLPPSSSSSNANSSSSSSVEVAIPLLPMDLLFGLGGLAGGSSVSTASSDCDDDQILERALAAAAAVASQTQFNHDINNCSQAPPPLEHDPNMIQHAHRVRHQAPTASMMVGNEMAGTRADLTNKIANHPLLQAFSSVLTECVAEGGFDQVILPQLPAEAHKIVRERPNIDYDAIEPWLTVSEAEFLAAHSVTSGTNAVLVSQVKLAFLQYMSRMSQIDQQRAFSRQELQRLVSSMKVIRPMLQKEEACRFLKVDAVYLHLKKQVNDECMPPISARNKLPTSGPARRRKVTATGPKKKTTSKANKSEGGPKKKRRGTLPKSAISIMRKWLFDHFSHPYPSEDEKQALAEQTGLKAVQVNYWFINARVRIWRPMIESLQKEPPQANAQPPLA